MSAEGRIHLAHAPAVVHEICPFDGEIIAKIRLPVFHTTIVTVRIFCFRQHGAVDEEDTVTSRKTRVVGITHRFYSQIFVCRIKTARARHVVADIHNTFHKVVCAVKCTADCTLFIEGMLVVILVERGVGTGDDDTFIERNNLKTFLFEFFYVDIFASDRVITQDDHVRIFFQCVGDLSGGENFRNFTGAFLGCDFQFFHGGSNTFCPDAAEFRFEIGNNGKLRFAVFDQLDIRMRRRFAEIDGCQRRIFQVIRSERECRN